MVGFLSAVSSTIAIEALKQVSQFSVRSPCSLSTDLSLWNSICLSISQINITVSLFAWLDELQSLQGHSILSKLEVCDSNLLLFPFNYQTSSPSIRRHLCHEAVVDLGIVFKSPSITMKIPLSHDIIKKCFARAKETHWNLIGQVPQ